MNRSTVPCPHCGAEIQSTAKFCRHCGSSDSDGWRDAFDADEVDDDFDYDEFVDREFGSTRVAAQTKPLWRWVAVVLLVVLVGGYLLMLIGT